VRKFGLFVALFYFGIIGAAESGKPKTIEARIDFSEGNYTQHGALGAGTVVIDSVTIERDQLVAEEGGSRIYPGYEEVQIGFHNNGLSDYFVTLKNKTVEQFARETVTLAFERSGYAVVQASDVGAEAASKVDVTVSDLWMWTEKIPDKNRWKFNFRMTTSFDSDNPALASLQTVSVSDFRNGGRDRHWKSYRNTIMHSMKAYVANFHSALNSEN